MDLSIALLLALLVSAACSAVESRSFAIYSQIDRPFRGGWLAAKVMEFRDEVDEDSNSQITIEAPGYNFHLPQGFLEQMLDKEEAIRDAGYMDRHLQCLLERLANRGEGVSRTFQTLRSPFERSQLLRRKFMQRHSRESNFICDTCIDIATRAEQVISNPDTMNKVIEVVNGSLCPFVMPGRQEECVSLAESYISQVFQLLKENLMPEHLCVETKLCASPTPFLHSDTLCQQCEKRAAEVITQLSENSTETQVMSALHLSCSKMGIFRTKCDAFVDTFGPAIFLKAQSMNPKEVCQDLKLCNLQKNYCATCEYVILQMKAQLRNPVNQEKLINSLSEECTKVSNYVDKCKEIVAEYAPFILANMDSLVDADTVCTKIHACEVIPASRMTPAERIRDSKEEAKETSEGITEQLIQLPSESHEHVIQ